MKYFKGSWISLFSKINFKLFNRKILWLNTTKIVVFMSPRWVNVDRSMSLFLLYIKGFHLILTNSIEKKAVYKNYIFFRLNVRNEGCTHCCSVRTQTNLTPLFQNRNFRVLYGKLSAFINITIITIHIKWWNFVYASHSGKYHKTYFNTFLWKRIICVVFKGNRRVKKWRQIYIAVCTVTKSPNC